jgi:hypothetical protein
VTVLINVREHCLLLKQTSSRKTIVTNAGKLKIFALIVKELPVSTTGRESWDDI